MGREVHVIGFGGLGRAIVDQLLDAHRQVHVIQRNRPPDLPGQVSFSAADVLSAPLLEAALVGASSVICAIGLPYNSKVWERSWPVAMANILRACEKAGARLVFADNLYAYGPQRGTLHEEIPLTDFGRKPRIRAEITRLWQDAHDRGRVQAVAVRSADFYGPGVEQSVLGAPSIKALAKGKPAVILGNPDQPHDVVHISDFARALITLSEADDDAYGQAWHVPSAPTMTLREHLAIAAAALDVPLRLSIMPRWAVRGLAPFVPILRESIEMEFMFDRPYFVDASKFRRHFWSDATSLEIGLAQTAKSFLDEAHPSVGVPRYMRPPAHT